MQFQLLGSGTSTGVPLPGCRCSVCTSKEPKNWRDRTSGLIRLDSGKNILIDTSTDLRYQAIKHDVQSVDAVLYTHAHADHILGMDDLRSFNFVHGLRIPCFGTAITIARLRETFPYIFQQDGTYEGGLLAQLEFCEFRFNEPFDVFGITITPLKLLHGKMLVAGFRIGSLGYATDCKALTAEAKEALMDCEYLFLDGLRFEPHPTHLTILEAIRLAQDLRAKQTYLIHLTHSVDFEEVNPSLPEGIGLGYDGLTVSFS